MRKHPFPLAAAFILAACASHAAEKPRAAQPARNQLDRQAKKVWTNDDMAELRSRALISIVGQEPGQMPASAPAPAVGAAPSFPAYDSRLDDPDWYAKTAATLQAELDQRTGDLQQERRAITLAKDRVSQPGVSLDDPSVGVTPAAALELLQSRVQEIQDQLDELADLARQHQIPPGDLRS
jgi:hypothetical protein